MHNFVIQYSWNNHKDMSQERLVEEFIKLPLYGRLQVYRVLRPHRKIVLRKGYNKYKKKLQQEKQKHIEARHKEELYEKAKTILSPLDGFLSFNDITTIDALQLTYAIIIKNGYAGYYDSYDSNRDKEVDSFNSTKEKMLIHIKRNESRDKMGEHTQAEIQKINDYYDTLVYYLEDLQYTPERKIGYSLSPKTYKWKQMYEHIGVGKILTSKIIKSLSDYAKSKGLNSKHWKWQKDMNKTDFHWQALATYNRADIATKNTDYTI